MSIEHSDVSIRIEQAMVWQKLHPKNSVAYNIKTYFLLT